MVNIKLKTNGKKGLVDVKYFTQYEIYKDDDIIMWF